MQRDISMKPRRIMNKKVKHHLFAYSFLIPILTSLLLFKYYPFSLAFIESFFDWNGANRNEFIGMENYRNLFKDEIFYLALKNIFILAISFIIAQIIFPLLAAVGVSRMMNKNAQNFYKLWFVIPMVVPYVIIFLLWRWIYNGDFGVVNGFLTAIGLESLTNDWLGDSNTALLSIVFLNFPWVGTISFLIYLAGVMSIPTDLFEVGKIEGMNGWQRLTKIEFPLLKNQIRLVIILALIQQFQSFENILILTNGGPGYTTITPALFIYREGIEYNRLGYASAIGVIVFLILLIVTVFVNKYMKQQNKVE